MAYTGTAEGPSLADRFGAIGLSEAEFARVTGEDEARVRDWVAHPAGADRAPRWVAAMVALLGMPGALDVARRAVGAPAGAGAEPEAIRVEDLTSENDGGAV